MSGIHHYSAILEWDGSKAGTTTHYKAYSRTHSVTIEGKKPFEMTADRPFYGDPNFLNPEDCLLAALSSCHMLSYLAFATMNKIEVLHYVDEAKGSMEQKGLGGHFTEVVLNPVVTISSTSDETLASELHKTASMNCFIASSVNFPVKHNAKTIVG